MNSNGFLIVDTIKHRFSLIFQVETLQKSLKSVSLNSMGSSNGSFSSGQDPSNLSMSQSVQNQLVQVKELEEEVSYTSILQCITREI